jgi:hypothetical protein
VALTSWQAETQGERGEQAKNRTDNGWHSHSGKQTHREREVSRPRTGQTMGGTHILASRHTGRER